MISTAARWADWLPPAPRPADVVPIYPANFSRRSDCPHAGPIAAGSRLYCEVCAAVSWSIQRRIDHAPAEPPVDPDTRVARLKGALAAGGLAAGEAEAVRARIAHLEAVAGPEIRPTKYVPDARLKGGK